MKINLDFERATGILMVGGYEVMGTVEDRIWLAWADHPTEEYQLLFQPRALDWGRTAEARRDMTGTKYKRIVVVGHATTMLHKAATDMRVSYIALRDRSCVIAGRVWPEAAGPTRLLNSALCALIRVLLSTSTPYPQDRPATGRGHPGPYASLAEAVGILQPHVSVLLKQKLPAGSVKRVKEGWVATDFTALWNLHMQKFEGPAGWRTGWRSPRSRATQARDLREAARVASVRGGTRLQMSGFEGMDPSLREAAWATEASRQKAALKTLGPAIVYSQSFTSALSRLGYTRCPLSAATVQLVIPSDTSIERTAAIWGSPRRTDPLVTAWEMRDAPLANAAQIALHRWAEEHAREN